MAKKVYHLSRTLLQKTGRDIVRLSALESLNAELEAKTKQLETVRSEGDRNTTVNGHIDPQRNDGRGRA
jgi:hypothetical protein